MFTWYSEVAKGNCRCRLRLYQISFDYSLIIVSELPDNSGRSITDESSTLINLACYQFGLAPSKVMWIEHYLSGYLKEDETYDEVMRGAGYISSRRIQKQRLEELLGVSL